MTQRILAGIATAAFVALVVGQASARSRIYPSPAPSSTTTPIPTNSPAQTATPPPAPTLLPATAPTPTATATQTPDDYVLRPDLNNGRWVEGPTLPAPRQNAAVAVLNGRIYLIGGFG